MAHVFGISCDNLDDETLAARLSGMLGDPHFHSVVSLNPEILVLGRRHPGLAEALRAANLRLPDGAGIQLVFSLSGEPFLGRHAGADCLLSLLAEAEYRGLSVFCAVRHGGLSDWVTVAAALSHRFPKLKVSGDDFIVSRTGAADPSRPESLAALEKSDLVFCNFGAPAQELFIESLRSLPGIRTRLGMGVGGAFEFLTGRLLRAPRFLQRLGLEWLWRLILQPSRLPRMWRAVVVFPWLVWWEKRKDPSQDRS